ncbi:GH3 auxin-responsive promoter family protein [Leptolyngbya sp. AN02str]|uniref:GH3 auxin-responsive promoter family protein n=1 Tax=Leptolyngbya sp. AN02str TaxID=3423363 RepID=UPI003D30F645
MTNLFLWLMAVFTKQARDRFVRKTKRVSEVQAEFLRSLLAYHQNTALGQALKLSNIQTVEQFRQQVPIMPYSAYEPYVARVAAGEQNVMTPDPVTYLNLTSGSTGKQKLIPVTKRSRKFIAKANTVGMGFGLASARQRGLTLGKMLITSSIQASGYTTGGIPYGPVSAGDLRMSNALYRQVFAHPFDVLRISDSLARNYVALLHALRVEDLRIIGANFPIFALRLCDYLDTYAEELLHDLENGAIADWVQIDPELRHQLERQLTPAPKRAAQLRSILKTTGTLTPQLVWPDLSFMITARGGTSSFYFERFPTYFGNAPVFGGVYASSEATFGVYHDFNQDGTILAIESGFFEFVPQDQWDAEHPKTLLPIEVTPGQQYRLLVTNYSGFYRYDIGDVVEVLGFYEQAPVIVFRHRLGGLLSSTTEKTTEFHATQVMQGLQQEFDLPLINYCITLSDEEYPPHYLVNIEIAPGHKLTNPKRFLERFDDRLKEIHGSYASKRGEQVPSPRLRILDAGSFAELQQAMVRRGMLETQLKIPHISEDRHFLAGLKVLQEVRMDEEMQMSR